MSKILIDEAKVKLALCKIKSARDCHPNAIDALLFEAEEILESALAEQPAQCAPAEDGVCESLDCPNHKPAQQEPVLQDIEQYRLQMAGICTAAIGYWKEDDGIHPDYDTLALRDVAKLYAKYDELYRAQPAQRTWVSLTDDEITDIWAGASPYYHEDDFARAIEAKLKEKNT